MPQAFPFYHQEGHFTKKKPKLGTHQSAKTTSQTSNYQNVC